MIKVGIIGLGLMGGSLAKALKIRYNNPYIVATNRSEDTLKKAYQDKMIDEYSTEVSGIFTGCDIIFICTPVGKIVEYVNKLLPYIDNKCILTDVGSTKGTIIEDIEKLGDKICFIGGHPMTGSEQTRYTSAKESLYENTYYILAPVKSVQNDRLNLLIDIVTKIGAIPVVLAPAEHDHIVAAISHVPHVIAATIVNLVNRLDSNNKYMHTLAAGGFKDITRIASSSPEMWQNISVENKAEILNVIKEFKILLSEYENNLLNEDSEALLHYFDRAKNYRDTFSNRNIASFNKYYEILVDILDQTGAIATIATLLSVNNINIKNIGIINNREYEHGVLQVLFDNEETLQKSIRLLKKMNYTVYVKH
jgi:prephenate dehydrogenase